MATVSGEPPISCPADGTLEKEVPEGTPGHTCHRKLSGHASDSLGPASGVAGKLPIKTTVISEAMC